jgi:hypothetical protein
MQFVARSDLNEAQRASVVFLISADFLLITSVHIYFLFGVFSCIEILVKLSVTIIYLKDL